MILTNRIRKAMRHDVNAGADVTDRAYAQVDSAIAAHLSAVTAAHLSTVTAAWREIDGKTNKACIAVYEARRLSKR